MRSVDRPGIELEVAFEITESVNFAGFHEFYNLKRNFEIDFRAIG